MFFEEFVDDLTKAIDRDERVHLEYVPTQIVVEYFRRQFHRDFQGPPLDGVMYPSARCEGGVAVALFCDRSAIVGIKDKEEEFFGPSSSSKWLELAGTEAISLPLEMIAEIQGKKQTGAQFMAQWVDAKSQ